MAKSMEDFNRALSVIGYNEDGPYLIGGKCSSCQTVFFPKRSICPKCIGRNIEHVNLSRKGKLYTYTEVHQKPPDYQGDVPYLIGKVLLPEGVFVLTQLKAKKEDLKVNLDVEMVVEPIYHNENSVERLGYKFKPA